MLLRYGGCMYVCYVCSCLMKENSILLWSLIFFPFFFFLIPLFLSLGIFFVLDPLVGVRLQLGLLG